MRAAGVLLAALLAAATASAATALDSYLTGFTALETRFTQVIRDARGKQIESGSGELLILRPGRFRWDYREAGAAGDAGQLLVCDGAKLWFYDRELAQVTVRAAAGALAATPISLLSGSAAEARAAFDIVDLPRRAGLAWVAVTPRQPGGDFARAELGFRNGELVSMQVNDKLGQTVTLQFTHSVRNARIDAARLAFTPPAGVDVIGGAQP